MAMCDASYNFTVVDIGAPGRCSEGGVFSNSDMGKGFLHKTLNFPSEREIDTKNGPIPYYAVGDEAFPLLENLMRPFPGRGRSRLPLNERIFNYRLVLVINVNKFFHVLSDSIHRLSRSRRTIENTFGILTSKWRIFRKPIIAGEDTVNAITKAAVVLQNFIKISENNAGIYLNKSQYYFRINYTCKIL